MMKEYFWRFVICLLPVALAVLVITNAAVAYKNGQGGFKLGVDLSGGTILVYEVDKDKFPDEQSRNEFERPPLGQQKGIDSMVARLKNRIDPADLYNVTVRPVGNWRVEIILPTGGTHVDQLEEANWQRLLLRVKQQFPPKDLDKAWDDLLAAVNAKFPPPEGGYKAEKGQVYDLVTEADEVHKDRPRLEIAQFVNERYLPELNGNRGRSLDLIDKIVKQDPENRSFDEVQAFVQTYYKQKERQHLTTEQIQEVKDLISRVGSLQFLILANEHDDAEAIAAAQKIIADPANKSKLAGLARRGRPPLPPEGEFQVKLNTGTYTYGYQWVEIGKSYLKDLGLNNASRGQPTWNEFARARDEGRTLIHEDHLFFSREIPNLDRLSQKDKGLGKRYEYFVLVRRPEKGKEVTGQYLVSAGEARDMMRTKPAVEFRFNDKGGSLFYDLTSKNAPQNYHRNLAVVLDDQVESAPRLNARISNSGIIEGNFTPEDIERLVKILRGGALPATLNPQPVSENTIGPTLGADTIKWGAYSVLGSFFAVLVFMLIYYRFAGFVACVALLANLLLTVAFMVLVNATFTLPGLAGLVLTLGMAVDANVLIYERLREERDRGATLALAIRNGYDRALPTIIDTHLSSIFTAIVLYAVGNDQLKGFGISLTVGLILSLFTSLYMTRTMFDFWMAKGWLKDLVMMRLLTRPNINFMAIRYQVFAATVIVTLLGAALFVYRLDKGGLNIDFVGGTAYGGQLTEMVTIQELREMLKASEKDLPDVSIEQSFVSDAEYSIGNKSKLFTIRTTERNAAKVQEQINKLLGDKLKHIEIENAKVGDDGRTIQFQFIDPLTKQPAQASRAQVSLLLGGLVERLFGRQFAEQLVVDGDEGTGRDGRYTSMTVTLPDPVTDKAKLDTLLAETKEKFATSPQPERLEVFDPQLASDMRTRAFYAILLSWGAVLLYLWFRFGSWTFGAAAVLCLIHDLCFTLGVIAVCAYVYEYAPALAVALQIQPFKIDLPAVAALLTLVGYSVNDTIVVFDRIREVRGKNPELTPKMVNDSINGTLSRTILASLTTFLVVGVLYWFGGEGVHLFAFVMVVGVIVGTFSSIYVASPLLLMFGEGSHAGVTSEREEVTAE